MRRLSEPGLPDGRIINFKKASEVLESRGDKVKATVIRVSHKTEKALLEDLQKKLDQFLSTPVEGKLPTVRFIAQSEHTPQQVAGLRPFAAIDPHVTITILWE